MVAWLSALLAVMVETAIQTVIKLYGESGCYASVDHWGIQHSAASSQLLIN